MAVLRHIYRHKMLGMVAINDRLTLQKDSNRIFEFNFTTFNAKVYVRDGYLVENGVKLHTGLEITTVLEGDPGIQANPIVETIIEELAGIFSFVTVASCSEVRLLSHILVDDTSYSLASFFSPLFPQSDVIIGTPRKIDETTFNQIWFQWDKNPHKDRVSRAMAWLGKGLTEESHIDKFISFWVGIEVIHSVLRRKLQQRVRDPGEWDGVKQVFNILKNAPTFDDIYEARNQLLHGYEEYSPAFSEKIESYIEPTRKAAWVCIGNAMDLTDQVTHSLIELNPRRLLKHITMELDGSLEGLKNNLPELLTDPPFFDSKGQLSNFRIAKNGKIEYDIKYTQVAHLPKHVVFHAKGTGLIGHGEAGIDDVGFKEEPTIEKTSAGL